jgi:hypothetical protein
MISTQPRTVRGASRTFWKKCFPSWSARRGGVMARLDARQTGWRDEQEWESFAIFQALFYCRTHTFHKEQTALAEQLYRSWMKANNPTAEITAQMYEEMAKETGEPVDNEIAAEIFKAVRDDAFDVEVPRQNIIRLMADSALHMAKILMTLKWNFVRAPPDLAFITSGAPFMIAPPPGMENDSRAYGVLTPGAAVTIPLSPTMCVVIQRAGGQDQYGHIRKEVARRINENVAKNSDRFVIAPDQRYLERLVKRTRIDHYRWTSRFEFNHGEIDGDLLFHAKRTRPPME